jgi:hypothetical protein
MKKLCFVPLLLVVVNCLAQIPEDSIVAFYPFNGNATLSTNRFGASQRCYVFNGIDQYIEFPDHDSLSIATTGKLSISIWMRPDTLNFEKTEGDGYVHWMGKGSSGQHEWLMRMYNFASTRPNRTSCYAFNLSGGLGSGSYVEETLTKGAWIHLTAVYNFPANEIKIYKNGVLRDTDYFTDYSVIPGNGTAPFRIGTRDFNSYFKGAIDDIRIYSRVLTASEINALYNEPNDLTSIVPATKSLIKIYPNPSNGVLVFDSGKQADNNFTIEVLNSVGNSVLVKQINSQVEQIEIGKVESKEIVMIRISDNTSGQQYVQKVVLE